MLKIPRACAWWGELAGAHGKIPASEEAGYNRILSFVIGRNVVWLVL
jgi:hypothetical protein